MIYAYKTQDIVSCKTLLRYEVMSNLKLAVGSLQIFIQLIPNTVNMVNS